MCAEVASPPSGCCQDGESVPSPTPLVAVWRLFDLGCADGSQPAGCQVGGGRVDMLSGAGGEYIVAI